MPALTASTIVDPDAYLAELERVRSDGYGLDEAENQAAGRCVSVVIPDIDIPAGLSMSAPADRFPPSTVASVAARLTRAARSLSRQIQA